MQKILFLILTIALSLPSWAQDKKSEKANLVSQKTDENSNGSPVQKKKIGVDQSDFMPSSKSFGLITSYSLFYDNVENVQYKTLTHQISFAGTYSFDHHWSVYSSLGFQHETYEDKIYKENDGDNFHSLSNLNLGVVYSKNDPFPLVLRSSNTLNISLPTSEQAQDDKHIGNISLINFMSTGSWYRFSLFNRIQANYLWNTLKYSRTTDLINRDWTLANSFGVTYMYSPMLGARASLNVYGTRYLTEQWIMDFGNSVALFANWQGFQFYASLINQSYPDLYRVEPVYFDRYRQMISAGVTYAF